VGQAAQRQAIRADKGVKQRVSRRSAIAGHAVQVCGSEG